MDMLATPSFHIHKKLSEKARFKSWPNNVKKPTRVIMVAKKNHFKRQQAFVFVVCFCAFLLGVEKAYSQEFMSRAPQDMRRCWFSAGFSRLKLALYSHQFISNWFPANVR